MDLSSCFPLEVPMKLRTFKAADGEYERWRRASVSEGLSLSAWIRRALNEREALESALAREISDHIEGSDGKEAA